MPQIDHTMLSEGQKDSSDAKGQEVSQQLKNNLPDEVGGQRLQDYKILNQNNRKETICQ